MECTSTSQMEFYERNGNTHVATEETVSLRRPKEDDNDGGDDTKFIHVVTIILVKVHISLSSMGYGGKSLLMNCSNNNDNNNSSSSNKRPCFARGVVSTTGSTNNNHNHLHNDIQTKSAITGVRYRTTTSIRYALEEIRKRKVQQLERKRAVMIPGFFYLPLVTKSSGCHAGELLV